MHMTVHVYQITSVQNEVGEDLYVLGKYGAVQVHLNNKARRLASSSF